MDKDSAAAWLIQAVQQPLLRPGQEATPFGTLEIIALTAEYRRLATGGHNWRVAHLAALLARTLGVQDQEVELLKQAAPLHDIGTIFIPEQILRKPDKLSSEEFSVVRRHVELGSRLLQASQSPLLQVAQTIIENHHERFDGSGYPSGKRGRAIPMLGQIVALADVFDTLTHAQPYRAALPTETALDMMLEARGKAFAPNLTDALFTVLDERYWLVREQAAPVPQPAREVLVEGKLGALSLFDLLGSLTQNKSSGHLYLELTPSQGLLVLTAGRIVHAAYETQVGEAALLTLFSKAETETNARFRLEASPQITPFLLATIETPTEKLLFDIAVKLDNEIAKRRQDSSEG
jgi:HD domain/Domain of unknown function (DUF4388)